MALADDIADMAIAEADGLRRMRVGTRQAIHVAADIDGLRADGERAEAAGAGTGTAVAGTSFAASDGGTGSVTV